MARGPAFYRQRAAQFARQQGLDPRIFLRQINQESGFRPGAVSGAGARGIAQIMPFHDVRPDLPGHQVAGKDPLVDLRWAAQHMASTLHKYKGSYKDALSVYNSGRPWSQGQGISETRNYVNKILNGADPRSNQNAAAPAGGEPRPGRNLFAGGGSARPQNLAGFLLNMSQRMAAGEPFNLGEMTMAMKADRDESLAATQGMDAGGVDPADPRVSMEQPRSIGKMPNAAAAMRLMIRQAQKMGLHVGSNEAVTGHPETSGHTKGSDHYKYLGPGVQAAIDVSGNSAKESAFFRWAESNRKRLGLKDLFFDPMKYSYDEGKRWGATIGGHGGHVHASLFPTPRRRR